jgi:beta-lactamase class A
MFKKQVPLYSVIIVSMLTTFATYAIVSSVDQKKIKMVQESANDIRCDFTIKRLSGYNYIKPLMFVETPCESAQMSGIKTAVQNVIDGYKATGAITSASVYLRDFSSGYWMNINENEKYSPGSLLKVPELIAFMKMNENHPGLLNKKIRYDRPLASDKHANFLSKSIVLGHEYTIRELLSYMITYSDNNATLLLNQQIDVAVFNRVFTDLGLPAPDSKANQYPITAKDYSLFMRALFNGSYLSIEDSEFCTSLLATCSFPVGMESGLPATVKMAHKFGEGGYDNAPQFSESGIVYINNRAYLLTVMTSGSNMKQLPKVVGDIAHIVYENMLQTNYTNS